MIPILPEPFHPVGVERCVATDKRETFRQCLGNKHPVKRIAMVHFKVLQSLHMARRDRQKRRHRTILYQIDQRIELHRKFELLQPHFNCDFPEGCLLYTSRCV